MRSVLAGRRVLLLEDEALVAMDLEGIVQDAGAEEVRLAMNLAEAWRTVSDWRPDLALLDVRLPDGSSHDLAAELHERGVHVLFHTGDADASRLAAVAPGAGVLRKPSSAPMIVAAISGLIDPHPGGPAAPGP